MSISLKLQRVSRHILMSATMLSSVFVAASALAAPLPLAPLTKLRLTVVQFVALTGEYKRWDALGGDMDVGPDGVLFVPILGSLDVSGMSSDELGVEIGARLQAKLGLLDVPSASVQILAYPPVYVVGNVANPGQYGFQPGMTVVQALALAGGEQRAENAAGMSESIRLQADLDGQSNDILRLTARIARLKAEFGRSDDITFPAHINPTDPSLAEIVGQERQIFQAHTNEFARQQQGLAQVAELYGAEIDALEQKALAIDAQIVQAQKQVDNLKALFTAGSATTVRLNEAERALADLRSSKLDNTIATLTAKENLNHSQRDLAKLQDEQQSETAGQLQQEQAALEKTLLSQSATARMLSQSVEFDRNTLLARTATTSLSYSIIRQQDGEATELDATEATGIKPGDLVRVTLHMSVPNAPMAEGAVPVAEAAVGQ